MRTRKKSVIWYRSRVQVSIHSTTWISRRQGWGFIRCHSRLCQRTSNHFYLNLHHEIFRYVFNGKGIINDSDITLFSKEDFSLFNLPENWDKIIYTDKGEGRQINFPVSLKPVLRWSKRHYVCSDGKLTDEPRMPVELLIVDFTTNICWRFFPKVFCYQRKIMRG
jgi:hypothetical protein